MKPCSLEEILWCQKFIVVGGKKTTLDFPTDLIRELEVDGYRLLFILVVEVLCHMLLRVVEGGLLDGYRVGRGTSKALLVFHLLFADDTILSVVHLRVIYAFVL